MKQFLFLFFLLINLFAHAQYRSNLSQQAWVDSVFNSLNDDERIAQLMVIRSHSNLGPEHEAQVASLIQKYNVGALCFFQGGPVRQANLTNYYQSIAKTPLMITIDGEWGLGMRLDSVTKFPYQLTLGALDNPKLIYEMGRAVAAQCKRIGININYAPVVDINNNPANPVIGYRSFGEDKDKVSKFGVAYMKGMQDGGIMACAKHFPGHGDVSVDSHLDLPVINKSIEQLDSLELMPFKALFKAGVRSVMVAHLSIPAIDTTSNLPTSISKNNVTGLLRKKLGFNGLIFTDALEMKGVSKYYPGSEAAVQALIAGNDMLCLPEDIGASIEGIKKAIAEKKLKWDDIYEKVKKVLVAKYQFGLNGWKPVDTANLVNDLNAETDAIRKEVAKRTVTLLKSKSRIMPDLVNKKIAYVGIGLSQLTPFGQQLKNKWGGATFLFSYSDSSSKADSIVRHILGGHYDHIIIGIHGFNLRPANNYGISSAAIQLWNKLQSFDNTSFVFGNVLATSNFCSAPNLVACYQDDEITQQAAADLLEGKIVPRGKIPVSVCGFKYDSGITYGDDYAGHENNSSYPKLYLIDSIAKDAIERKAFPGCVVLAARDGKLIYYKAFGNYEYGNSQPVSLESIYDLASVTKVSATTIAVMKLYQEGKLDLNKTLGDYLTWTKGTDKAHLKISEILLHQAGLVPFISFYKETIDSATGAPNPAIYSEKPKPGFTVRVAENLYLRNDWNDTMFSRILKSPLGPSHKYVYSDNDFIFLGKIVEAISGMTLDEYAQKNFYDKMGLTTTGFKPRNRFSVKELVPTEEEKHFRRQLIRGDVHDEGSSMFGGVSGHAGLFSDAYDLAMLWQMLLNGGKWDDEQYLKPETIKYFSAYHSEISRRGFGFDKPEKDNSKRKEPYPCLSASPETFGHTGFTGTCVWADPKYNLVFIFLSNRVYPTRDNSKLSDLNVRPKIQETVYDAIRSGE